ncbi:MAG: hypothetical protein ACFCGT_25840 [Sandaracinaceae bacterium]
MRERLVLAALAIGVLGLVALNLAVREDPDPDLGPTTFAPPAESDLFVDEGEEGDGEGAAPDPPAGATAEAAPARSEGSPVVPDTDPPSTHDEADDLALADGGCEHPFVPSRPGTVRRYVWRQSDEGLEASLSLEALDVRRRRDGQRLVRWRARVQETQDDERLGAAVLSAACRPGVDAEEPWFGVLERSLGLTPGDGASRWRWPVRLAPEVRFEGTATFDPADAEMAVPEGAEDAEVLQVVRRHTVEARERVEVPAGTFEAWRIAYEERHAFGEHGETGTGELWVAEGVGLVKSAARNAAGILQTIELLEAVDPAGADEGG